jgi:hypothetical protein
MFLSSPSQGPGSFGVIGAEAPAFADLVGDLPADQVRGPFVHGAIAGGTVKGKQRRVTLGEVVDGNLKAMRLAASAILSAARPGTDGRGRGKSCRR